MTSQAVEDERIMSQQNQNDETAAGAESWAAKQAVTSEPASVAAAKPAPKAAAAAAGAEGGERAAPAKGSAVLDSTIRVDVALLDKLMNLVGELVLARNQVLQFTARLEASTFNATSQRLNLITSELQKA